MPYYASILQQLVDDYIYIVYIIYLVGGCFNPSEKSADPGLRQGRGGAWDHRRCGSCLSWTLATPNAAGKSHHKATAMAQEHPTAAAMASFIGVQGCRLPGLKPSTPSNSSKSLPNSAGKRCPNKPNTRHARRQKPPQGHSIGSRAPHGRSNGFLSAFQAAVCQASNPPNPPNPPKVRPTPQAKGTPTSPTRATPAGKSHHKATAMAQGHPPAAAMASYRRSRLPFARPQTLQTLQKSAQLGREKVPQQAQHAPRPQAKATTRPQQWLKGTPRPQQWLLIGVQGCRLPGLKPSKRSKSPPSSAGKRYPNKPNTRHARRQKPPQGHSNGSRALPGRSNGFLYRRSRLPFARPQTLQKSAQLSREKVPQQAQHAPRPQAKPPQGHKPNTRHARRQKPPQGHSNGSRAPHGRSNGFLSAFQAAVCQASNPPNPPNPPKVRPTPQAQGTPTSPTRATPAGKSHHKATAMAQGHPPAAAMASYRRSRLPFARPQTLQTLQKSAQLGRDKVPKQAQHAPRPQAKATTRPQQWLKGTPRPQQWLLIGVQGCRLPGLKRSKRSKSPPSSAGKRYPNKPNTRHARRQKPPQGHSNGSRAPPGRSNGFL